MHEALANNRAVQIKPERRLGTGNEERGREVGTVQRNVCTYPLSSLADACSNAALIDKDRKCSYVREEEKGEKRA
jgi:hypothetical protein